MRNVKCRINKTWEKMNIYMSKTLSIAEAGEENDQLKLENLANQAGLPDPAFTNKILVVYARDTAYPCLF